jgi:hypothetical protein
MSAELLAHFVKPQYIADVLAECAEHLRTRDAVFKWVTENLELPIMLDFNPISLRNKIISMQKGQQESIISLLDQYANALERAKLRDTPGYAEYMKKMDDQILAKTNALLETLNADNARQISEYRAELQGRLEDVQKSVDEQVRQYVSENMNAWRTEYINDGKRRKTIVESLKTDTAIRDMATQKYLT